MNQKFRALVQPRDGASFIKLAGIVDEDNTLADLTNQIPAGATIVDLAEVDRINSCGVRDWVNWLSRIERSGAKPVLVECSPAIVAQINLVHNFTGSAAVKSFYAPYFCQTCNREKVLLIDVELLGPPPYRAPTCRCDECDGVMDFDDMEESYFAFVASARRVSVDASLSKALAAPSQNGGRSAGPQVNTDGDQRLRSKSSQMTMQPPSGVTGAHGIPVAQIARNGTVVGTQGSWDGRSGSRPGQGTTGASGTPASDALSALKQSQMRFAERKDARKRTKRSGVVWAFALTVVAAGAVVAVVLSR